VLEPPSQSLQAISFQERAKCGEDKLLILYWLLAKWPNRRSTGLLNLKDLLTMFPAGVGALFRVLSGDGNVPPPICLIRQGLIARLRRRTDEGLLNLKDLLTVFPASRKGSFENEPVLRPPIRAESRQISPFSRKNAQKSAQKGGFSASVFWGAQ